jgi:hypothetical protein
MRFNRLSLKDKHLFQKFLDVSCHSLCAYAFQNIYIWKGLFDISWTVIDNNLCVFFRDRVGCFLYLPPLAQKPSLKAIEESFAHMDKINKNRAVSRIENVESSQVEFFKDNGYICASKPPDYICETKTLVGLKGDGFKSKRACINYFVKKNAFDYISYGPEYEGDCISLYEKWMENRKLNNSDRVYQGMLYDNLSCLKVLLKSFKHLDCSGRLIKIEDTIKAFTFGFGLNKNVFCILFEIADLSVKGSSQYIFWKFSSELKDYRYINIMDDSGLLNLKTVKSSYHPEILASNFIISRPHA